MTNLLSDRCHRREKESHFLQKRKLAVLATFFGLVLSVSVSSYLQSVVLKIATYDISTLEDHISNLQTLLVSFISNNTGETRVTNIGTV